MKNRPSSSRIFGAVLALGSMLGLRNTSAAAAPASTATPTDSTAGYIPHRIHGHGATPDVWGQSGECRRMVHKNFLARRARS